MQKTESGRNLARQGKVDVRRDEDQNIKLSQTIKLLIEAGYYRARVKGLSPFDKIVGGMTWCIEVCNFDIDVDLLFHESLTIGQKISLTEKIVKVLPYMKCPFSIEPHQIQGLDTIHIFPVIEWLVAQALETRYEYQDETRVISLNEFQRHYEHSLDHPTLNENLKQIKRIVDVKLIYGPKIRFKRIEKIQPHEVVHPLMTLLEYAETLDNHQLCDDSDSESINEDEEEIQNQFCKKMIADANYNTRSSVQVVSNIVEDQITDIGKATNDYIKLKEIETTFASENVLSAMESKVFDIQTEKELRAKALSHIMERESEIVHQINLIQENLSKISKDAHKCENSNIIQKKEILEALSQLLEENETLKKSSSHFKEKCRQEAEEMRRAICDVRNEVEKERDSVSENVLHSHALESSRLKKVRELVAQKSREIEALKRIIDDVPGRAELSQYQKRFVELFNLVGAEHHETLQFYNMYNSLADSRSYMEKESDLLNSILDNMEQGLSTSSIEEYVNQLKSIIEGVIQNKVKLENKRNEERNKRTTLSAELNRLQDLQIHYVRLLHLFSQEIAANEILLETIES